MASSNASEANFRINVDGNASTSTKDVASSARLAAKAIETYENEVKTLSGDLRRLRGNSDEVTAAKKAIKDRIDAAKTSVSALTVELNKQGTSYAAAAKAAKDYKGGLASGIGTVARNGLAKLGGLGKGMAAPIGKAVAKAVAPAAKALAAALAPAAKKVTTALAPAGRAVAKFGAGAKKAFGAAAEAAKPVTSALPSMSTVIAGLSTIAAAAAAAVIAVGVAAGAGVIALGAFGLAAASSAAQLKRNRQALLGNADDAGRLGDQIVALAGKVPQGTAELQELSMALSKTRLSGKAIVNTMNAVAQATGAVDAGAGAKIQEIITRGQNTGRLFLGALELQGTGIDFNDVAAEYAAGTKKSLAAARAELQSGAAPLEAGAEAIRKATEKKFGKLNIANAFSIENAPKKFFEQFQSLASGIDLSGLTDGIREAFAQLSPDAPLGRGVKVFMEGFGTALADIAGKSIPVLLEGFKWLVVGALRVGTYFYELKSKVKDAFASGDWGAVGKEIVFGIVKGIVAWDKFAIEAVTGMAKAIKRAFTGKEGIDSHSPSKAFEKYGGYSVEGYARGVEKGSARAQGAVVGMLDGPAAPRGGGSDGGGSIVVNIHGAPVSDIAAMLAPAFLAAITRAVRDARTAQGAA